MLGPYLDTLTTGHTFCSFFITLYELTLQKKLQNSITNQKTKHKKPCQSWGKLFLKVKIGCDIQETRDRTLNLT